MAIETRLTERFGIEYPIVSAPMAFAAGGKLAAAVTSAGGLGLIGGGYGDADWLKQQLAKAGNARVGCGFISWSLARQPELLELVLSHSPAAVMLSFGSPEPFATQIKQTGTPVICQVQTMEHARAAIDAGADILVAQGAEAGGHGLLRATFTLVPEVADMLAERSPNTLLLAAGGIADGRGLAASLLLGADGVLIGSRFWGSAEALVHTAFQDAAVAANGDSTIRTTVPDKLRDIEWPEGFTARVMRNWIIEDWHGRESQLIDDSIVSRERTRYVAAMQNGDADNTGVWVGEAAGLMHDIPGAGALVRRIADEAEYLLSTKAPGLAKAAAKKR